MSNSNTVDNITLRFIEQVVGISIPESMRLLRKQFLKDIAFVLQFIKLSRTTYFNLKSVYPDADTDVLSLMAWIVVAKEVESKSTKPVRRSKVKRNQPKRDFILDRSALICEWLNDGSSIRDISSHLLNHHRQEISPTYLHRVIKEMNWTGKGHQNED